MEDNQEIRMVWPELEHQLSSLVDHNGTQEQKEGLDQTAWGTAAAVKLLICLLSLTANFCCVALVNFFLTTLPHKRNLLTFFDIVLVVALTSVVDIAVRITLF